MQRQTKTNNNKKNKGHVTNDNNSNNIGNSTVSGTESDTVMKLDLSSDPIKDYLVVAGLIITATIMGIYYYYHGVPFAPDADPWQRNGVIATVVVLYRTLQYILIRILVHAIYTNTDLQVVCAAVYMIDREQEMCTFDKRRNTMQLCRQVSRVHQPQIYVQPLNELHHVEIESIKNNKFHRYVAPPLVHPPRY